MTAIDGQHPGTAADPRAAARHPLPFRLLPAAPTDWDPAAAQVTLNVRLDGCIVPSEASAEGARISYSHAGARVCRRQRRVGGKLLASERWRSFRAHCRQRLRANRAAVLCPCPLQW